MGLAPSKPGIDPTASVEPSKAAKRQAMALVRAYAAKSDSELTALSSHWQQLDRLERQVLLREVKMRMARQQGRQGVLRIRTERRFGRVVRQPDGSVVRLETRVVQIRKAPPGQVRTDTPRQVQANPRRLVRGAPALEVRSAGAGQNAAAQVSRQYGTGFSKRQKAPSPSQGSALNPPQP